MIAPQTSLMTLKNKKNWVHKFEFILDGHTGSNNFLISSAEDSIMFLTLQGQGLLTY